MVFESLVVDLINKYLGNFIVKLDKSQLSIGLFGGNVTLENLDIKENAFDEFNLPIKVFQGHISKLTLKIPWKHIYSEPVIAELDGLYVLALPNSEVKYDPKKERVYQIESKQKELNLIEENKLKRLESKKDTDVKDSFAEKLAAQIIKNVQITISNIHIRYEDMSTCPERPFSVGITLANLSFQTCDVNGTCIIIKDDSVKAFWKSVKMDSLAVYWNSKPKPFSCLNPASMKATMKSTIRSYENKTTDLIYLIRPISFTAMTAVNMKPELTMYKDPRFSINFNIDQIGFACSRNQYCDIASFMDSLDQMQIKNRFRKYHPNVPLKSNIRQWWLFPYHVIMEEQVQRRRRMWSWKYIKAHRDSYRAYTKLWEQKLMDKKWTQIEQDNINRYEEELDLLNITLCRQQAEMKAKQMKKKLDQKKTGGDGWFSGWFGKSDKESKSPSNSSESDDLQRRLQNEFTPEEKAKLYEAIDYSELTKDSDIPRDYVSLILNLKLEKLTFLLSDDSLKESKLMKLSINSMSSNVLHMPSANSVTVGLQVNKMQVLGSKYEDGTVPTLVSTQCIIEAMDLLNIKLEINPLDQSVNQRINIRAAPLEIIYDSETINRVVKFFTPPEELQLYGLSTQVITSIGEVKEMTATGLRYLADTRLYTDINVDVKPSYFILPETGRFFKDCKMLLFDLGSIKILSERTKMDEPENVKTTMKNEKLDYNSLKETAYDKFCINLSKLQVLMIERGDNWQSLRSQEISPNHILKPFGFDFDFKKCVITNDVNLPKLMIKGCLPHLGITLSDGTLKSILELILHIPFPETTPPREMPTTEHILKDFTPIVGLSSNQIIKTIVKLPDSETASLTSTVDNDDDDDFKDALENFEEDQPIKNKKQEKNKINPNLIELNASFIIGKMQVEVFEEYQNSLSIKEIRELLNLVISEVSSQMVLRRFDTTIEASVGSLMLTVPCFIDHLTKLPIYLAQTEKETNDGKLLSINLVIAEKTGPDFLTIHKNSRHTLNCNFKSLEVCVHQEAILMLLNFSNTLIPVLNVVNVDESDNWSAKVGDEVGGKIELENKKNNLDDKQKGLRDTSVLEVITSRIDYTSEKKSVRIKAETESELSGLSSKNAGNKIYIPENYMTQWAVYACWEKFQVSFANEKENNIFEVSINGMRADIKISYYTTEISVSITDMQIKDPKPESIYKQIIWIDKDESIFNMQIVIFNQGTTTPGYELDLNRIDHSVNMYVGKMKMILIYSFVDRLQTFFGCFQEHVQAILDKAQQYSTAAANRLTNVLEDPPSSRTMLNIKVNAPVIYFPENSKSSAILIFDLGSLTFMNEFVKDSLSPTIILEKSTITLDNVSVSRALLIEIVVKSEKKMLMPININIEMIRNLSWNLNSKIPQIDIKAIIKCINLDVSHGDCKILQLIINSNLNEGSKTTSPSISAESTARKDTDKEEKVSSNTLITNDRELSKVKFSFVMESLNIDIFEGEAYQNNLIAENLPDKCLTEMKCSNLIIGGQVQLNFAIEISIRLDNICLIDKRINSPSKDNELIRKKKTETKDVVSLKFIREPNGDVKTVTFVAGLYACVSMDYIMVLVDFYSKVQVTPETVVIIPVKDVNKTDKKTPEIPIEPPRLINFEIDLTMERPDIMLVEDFDNPDSNAILLQTQLVLKFSMLKDCDLMNVEFSNFQAIFCPFKEENRKKNMMDIITPTSIAIYSNKPINNGMQSSLTLEHLIINITPTVIQSISKILQTFQVSNADNNSLKDDLSIANEESLYIEDFWKVAKFNDNDYLFITNGLKEKDKADILDNGYDIAQDLTDGEEKRPNQMYLRLPDIKIILESEVAKKCVPLLIIESSVDGYVKGLPKEPNVSVTVCVSVSYFNDHINVWEPLIEVYPEENNRQFSFELEIVTFDSNLARDEDDIDMVTVNPPTFSVLLQSRDSLEMTLSKTSIVLLTNLAKAFQEAYSLHLEEHRSVIGAPYVVSNTCGKDVFLYITDDFDMNRCKSDEEHKILIKSDNEIFLYDAIVEKQTSIIEEKQAKPVKFRFTDCEYLHDLLIDKTETRGLALESKNIDNSLKGGLNVVDNTTVVVSTTAYLGMKNLELRSILQVFNNSADALTLYYKPRGKSETSDEFVKIIEVSPSKSFNVPIPVLQNDNGQIFISVKELDTDVSTSGALWNLDKKVVTTDSQILECKTKRGVKYYYSALLTTNKIASGKSSVDLSLRTYRLDFNAPIRFHNQLPIAISYQSQGFIHNIEPGCHELVKTASLNDKSELKITYTYQNKEWFGTLNLGPKMDELIVINFKSKEGFNEFFRDLGLHVITQNGRTTISLYSSYWMINKTGHTLTYKAGDDYQVIHDANNHDAVLFSFLSKSMFQSKKKDILSITMAKAHLKIDDSQWSDKFSLDTVGSNGKVVCKKKPLNYEIAVKINLSSSGLTKIITFLPYYMILNQSSIILHCRESVDQAEWITIPPGEAVPFWPRSEVGKSMMMCCKVMDGVETQNFHFYECHSVLMKLEKKYIGIFVEVQITEEANLISLQLYQDGMALVKLINHLGDNVPIYYKQQDVQEEFVLSSNHSVMYAWQDANKKRELVWRVDGMKKKTHPISFLSDSMGEIFINEMKAYWVSFVWENHRILLFTNDMFVAKHARLSDSIEPVCQEITISIHSIGLSVVDNLIQQELCYISITNSGVKWCQLRKKGKQKPLKLAQSEALETFFEEFSNKMKTGYDDSKGYIINVEGVEVDLSKKYMLKPEYCPLTRVFEPGVFLQYQTTKHQMLVHFRFYKVQIDNQLTDCGFPVVFAAFPQPKTVALDTGLKPFIELSAIIIQSGDTFAMRFKYFKVLIQEMQVMVDQIFLNSFVDFIYSNVPTTDEELLFKKDCQLIQDKLIDTSTIKSILQGGKKCAFDEFHISPMKIHLSFSLSNTGHGGNAALHSEVLNLFLQSVGIALTDVQDVIFKLGYFEKKNSTMAMNQMISVIITHYVSQALRQMYVLVLGLDVLGNPFGVIRGVAQGVEDLFYEPVRGAVLGPEEFAEGVAYGVRSLFGHAVGGAAGAVSRIVGTMGKGIAALTLDADYQQKRREQMSKRPENIGVGLAQGGKGIIFGIVQGVTGVVTKPIDGARKDGVEGFFKGVGKGLVGVVTRPVSGVVDFASSSFDGIRRVADTSIEVVRIRPPRYIAKDGIIKSYGLRKAEGNNIWNKVKEKANPVLDECYVFHVNLKSKKNVILLTNERVFHLERNDILGIWSIQWQIPYCKLNGAPTVNDVKHSIVFTLKEKQQKMFSKDNITKEIVADNEAIKIIIKKVTKIQKAIEKNKQYSIKN